MGSMSSSCTERHTGSKYVVGCDSLSDGRFSTLGRKLVYSFGLHLIEFGWFLIVVHADVAWYDSTETWPYALEWRINNFLQLGNVDDCGFRLLKVSTAVPYSQFCVSEINDKISELRMAGSLLINLDDGFCQFTSCQCRNSQSCYSGLERSKHLGCQARSFVDDNLLQAGWRHIIKWVESRCPPMKSPFNVSSLYTALERCNAPQNACPYDTDVTLVGCR